MSGHSSSEVRTTGLPQVRVLADPPAVGRAAAADIAAALRSALDRQRQVRVVFAAAPSQEHTLRGLAAAPGIEWDRVTAFHMDEYLGLAPDHDASFGAWLRAVLFDAVPLGSVHLMRPGGDAARELERYVGLLSAAPIDVLCCGIGVNGHLAFNDPPADFADPKLVKLVELSVASRQQQVDDGCFARLADVPTTAMTMTIPALLSAAEVFSTVPGVRKRAAVRDALLGPVREDVPASALQLHPRCTVYLDAGSALPGDRDAATESTKSD